jgi:hypothetical protein
MATNGTAKLMSIRSYAKSRRCAEGTVRFHVRKGVIVLRNGMVDPEQADLAWARRRHNRPGRDPGSQAAAARIRKMRALLELKRNEITTLDDQYAPRSDAVAQYGIEADYVLERLRAMPAIEADQVAQQLGISREKALALLERFINLCLDDLGDLRGRLVEVVNRV